MSTVQTIDLAEAAELARYDLKTTYPGVRFSVRLQRTDTTLTIRWTDGPTETAVRDLLARYKGWHLDPANGCHVPRPDRSPLAAARHIATSRAPSAERTRAIAAGITAANPGVTFTDQADPFNDLQPAPESLRFEGTRHHRPHEAADLGMLARRIFDTTNA